MTLSEQDIIWLKEQCDDTAGTLVSIKILIDIVEYFMNLNRTKLNQCDIAWIDRKIDISSAGSGYLVKTNTVKYIVEHFLEKYK